MFSSSIPNLLAVALALSSAPGALAQDPSISEPVTPPPATTNDLLCDWTRSVADCRDVDFIRNLLIVSSVLHIAVGFYGIWLMVYRNRGFNRKIVTQLFSSVGTGIRPKPMDCIIFFTTIACFVKIPGNIPLIFDFLRDMYWLRITLDQLYWMLVAFAFSSYFVGLLYAMPVTRREGVFAIYQPEISYGSNSLPPIHVLTPTSVQKNIILLMGLVYPLIGTCLGTVSGAFHDRGQTHASWVFFICEYANWVVIMYLMAVMFFYYGLKYTFILRANIIIAETALKAPRAAFGIGNLNSRSPARFLFIQLQITGFGGCAVTVLAGSLCLVWVLFRERILGMQDDRLPHTIAFFWTVAMAVAFLVVYALISAQSVRNRRRGLHAPSTTVSPISRSYPPSASNGSGGNGGGRKHSALQQNLDGVTSKDSKHVMSRFDPEAYLTQGSLNDVSTLHSAVSVEKLGGGYLDHDNMEDIDIKPYGDQDSDRGEAHSLTPPPRPLALGGSGSKMAIGGDRSHSQIRESVFGSRTPRDESGGNASSPPQSPTSPGLGLPSFPLATLRSSSRNSVLSRPSTSSVNPSYNTTSTRLSDGSTKHGGSPPISLNISSLVPSATPTSPSSPTSTVYSNNIRWSIQQPQHLQQGPSSPPPLYSPQVSTRQVSLPMPQLGGGFRKQSNADTVSTNVLANVPTSPTTVSAPVQSVTSRSFEAGHRAQGIEMDVFQHQQVQQLQLQQQRQLKQLRRGTIQKQPASELEYREDDASDGSESWPLPPSSK
ncbi:hypothetical protein BGZ99_000713 [Dissophora globulifera]|uniref:Uncharacterized protein n=1 Tax=Dissophora globulifera TaxID=979702 RepID=A0A9P6ULD3_9FUNG|nr:hypothetical protein BGZ99_000713 [Dissophora globulifera]